MPLSPPLAQADDASVEAALVTHYFSKFPAGYLDTPEGTKDLWKELRGRFMNTQATIIPWLQDAGSLHGARVLEIGCGTGSASMALASCGATVVGIDVLHGALEVARVRARQYGFSEQCTFLQANATEAADLLRGEHFDWIIFYASLEHMTTTEKIDAIRSTWAMLPPGGRWVIVESPNRLWHFDGHSSLLSTFHWLPDDLAILYTERSPRESMRTIFRSADTPDLSEKLARYGRCISFHEFELALGDARTLQVVSSLGAFAEKISLQLRTRRALARVKKWITRRMLHEDYLATLLPGWHRGWFDEYLDLIIQKR